MLLYVSTPKKSVALTLQLKICFNITLFLTPTKPFYYSELTSTSKNVQATKFFKPRTLAPYL